MASGPPAMEHLLAESGGGSLPLPVETNQGPLLCVDTRGCCLKCIRRCCRVLLNKKKLNTLVNIFSQIPQNACVIAHTVGSLWPLSTVRPVAESPPDDPVPVGVDVVDRLQEAEPQGGNVECEQHLPPFPAYYPAPYPVPYPVPYPAYAYPYAPYPYLYAPLAFPGAAPHPFAAPYAFPSTFPHTDPPAAPHPSAASADAAPAVPPAEPHLNRYGESIDDAVEAILARNRYVEPEEDGEPEIDVVGLDEEVEVPGISSSRKRTRDDSAGEESDAKRWR
ncbi:NADH-quinone oxidoreductase subunit I 2-like [Epinephelus fuscoguttatus]|uniref:NADH-quinone oxidoreductase subunit I 2-like n=1 Tax=Epinephelus fuscoguttatus TaxID=293821 RepID=UPI0020D022EA|nr:NADH-quinone oxidoreductase subunit I 2-like [Epinephelus fuscoguttatus]